MIDFLPPLNSPWGVSFYSFAGSLIYLTRKSFKKTWNAVMKEQYPVTVYESKEAASKEELSTEIKPFFDFLYKENNIYIVYSFWRFFAKYRLLHFFTYLNYLYV